MSDRTPTKIVSPQGGLEFWNTPVDLNSISGSSYDELVKANPYANSVYGDPTVWDKLGDWLGFHTKQDRYEMDRKTKSAQYLAELASIRREESYNSAEEQSQRLRNAGINPDLNGNVGSGEASEMNEPETPGVDVGSDGSQIASIFSTVMGAFNGALGLASQFVSLNGMVRDVQGKSINNLSNLDSLVLHNVITSSPLSDPDYMSDSADFPNLIKGAFKEDFINPFEGSDRRLAKLYRNRYNYYKGNLSKPFVMNQILGTRNKYLKSYRENAFESGKNQAILGSSTDSVSNLLSKVVPFMEKAWNIENKKQRNEAKKLDNDYAYQDELNTTLEAQAENSVNENQITDKETQNELRTAFKDMIDSIKQLQNDGNGFERVVSQLMLLFLYGSQFGMIK